MFKIFCLFSSICIFSANATTFYEVDFNGNSNTGFAVDVSGNKNIEINKNGKITEIESREIRLNNGMVIQDIDVDNR